MAEEDAVGWTDNTSLRAQIVPQTPTLTNSVRSTTPAGVDSQSFEPVSIVYSKQYTVLSQPGFQLGQGLGLMLSISPTPIAIPQSLLHLPC